MTNFLNRKFSLAIGSVIVCTTPFAFTSLTSCSSDLHKIQFANFESYMDGTLMNHLADTYDVQFQWYTVTEMIETKFKRFYDVAAPSGYELAALYKKGLLEPIDWEQFNIDGIKTSEDALDLFADDVKQEIVKMNTIFSEYLGTTFNVLNYGVPYFAQTLNFVYKGDVATFYKNGTTTPTTSPTWEDIFYSIGPKNPNVDQRFLQRRIGLLDDAKTMYDISRIMETGENIMPDDADQYNLMDTLTYLTNKARQGWYSLNTDSGIISRNLADHSSNSYIGAITWSGDALYSALGAGEFEPYSGSQMHIQPASDAALNEIEFLVINKKNHDDVEKLGRIYNLIFDVCLDGCKAADIDAKVGDRYKYWSMQNWDTVNYTPPLKTIYDYATNPNSEYWDGFDSESKQLFISILKVPTAKPLFGRTLSQLQNSNLHWAWNNVKGNL